MATEQKQWAVHILFTAETIVYLNAASFFDACRAAEELDIEDLNLPSAHISTTKAMNATVFPALAAAQETK